jgi:hypothetical protein
MNNLKEDFEKIHDRLNSIDVTLAKQSVLLSEHIRRTNLLEEKLEPVEEHVAHMRGALKLVLIIAALSGILGLVFKLH